MDKIFEIPTKTMTLNDWIFVQEDGDELVVQHVVDKESGLVLTGLANKRTKELYIVAERKVEQ